MADHPRGILTGSGINLFKIAGIQIVLDYSWFIIFLLVLWSLSAGYFPHYYPQQSTPMYWLAGFIATMFFFASILIHELSHAMMSLRAGIHIPAITLFVFGGMAHIAEDAKTPATEFKIAVVGPLTSLGLAAIFWVLKTGLETDELSLPVVVFEYLAYINLALGIFNLIPGFPLDGGRVFRAFWWWKSGSVERATRAAADIGKGFAVTLMILGALQIFTGALVGGIWFIFIGMFLRGMAEGGYQQLMIRRSLGDLEAREMMVPRQEVVTVPPDLSLTRIARDYFLHYGYRGFPVVEDGKVLGVISLDQLKGMPEEDRAITKVEQVMTPLSEGNRITPNTSLHECLRKMSQEGKGRLLVMDGGTLVGMVTQTALLRYLEITRALKE